MSVKVRVGGEKLDLANELREEFHREAKDAVSAGADILLEHSRRKAEAYGPGPAPPGSTPGTDSGDLVRLMKRRAPRVRGDVVSAAVKYAPHAHLVEYGYTKPTGQRVLPRPFVRPAVKSAQPEIDRVLMERLT